MDVADRHPGLADKTWHRLGNWASINHQVSSVPPLRTNAQTPTDSPPTP